MSPYDRDRWGEYWRFTAQSLGRLLGDVSGSAQVRSRRTETSSHRPRSCKACAPAT